MCISIYIIKTTMSYENSLAIQYANHENYVNKKYCIVTLTLHKCTDTILTKKVYIWNYLIKKSKNTLSKAKGNLVCKI